MPSGGFAQSGWLFLANPPAQAAGSTRSVGERDLWLGAKQGNESPGEKSPGLSSCLLDALSVASTQAVCYKRSDKCPPNKPFKTPID